MAKIWHGFRLLIGRIMGWEKNHKRHIFSQSLFVIFFLLFSVSACFNAETSGDVQPPPEFNLQKDQDSGPTVYPISSLTPLDGNSIFAQVSNDETNEALVVGLAGSVRSGEGVTQVCMQKVVDGNPTGLRSCAAVSATGSFRSVLEGVVAGDQIAMWPETPDISGDPLDPNVIVETVLKLSSYFPSDVLSVAENSAGLFVGTQIGLYVIWQEYVNLPIDEIPRPVHLDLLDTLPSLEIGYLQPDGNNGMWMVAGNELLHLQVNADREISLEAVKLPSAKPGGLAIEALLSQGAGFVWVGTTEGLFSVSRPEAGLVKIQSYEGVTLSTIRAIAPVGLRRLWLGGNGGLGMATWSEDGAMSFRLFPLSEEENQPTVHALAPAPNESLWIRTLENMYYVPPLSGGFSKLHRFWVGSNDPEEKNARIHLSIVDSEYVWTNHDDVLTRYRAPDVNGALELPIRVQKSLQTGFISFLFPSSSGGVWVGGRRGLAEVQIANVDEVVTRNFTSEKGLPSISLGDIVENMDGSLWVGTDNGLVRVSFPGADSIEFDTHLPSEVYPKISDKIFALAGDERAGLWIGIEKGLWKLVRDQEEGSVERVRLVDSAHGKIEILAVSAMSMDPQGGLWISALLENVGDRLVYLSKRSDGQLWAEVFVAPSINELVSDGQSGVWISSDNAGLYHYWKDGNGGLAMVNYTRESHPALLSNQVSSLLLDAPGDLWVGTSLGVVRFEEAAKSKPEIRSFSANSTLPSLNVNDLQWDANGDLWVGTPEGLVKVEAPKSKTPQLSVFAQNDGLPSPSIRSILPSSGGGYWIATYGFLSLFNP